MFGGTTTGPDLHPAIADGGVWRSAQAFSSMMIDEQRQAILISGESGAGKTESAKMVSCPSGSLPPHSASSLQAPA